MPWYTIVLIVCMVIGPFDALYLYIRSEKRRERLKREQKARDDDGRDTRDDDRRITPPPDK